MAKRAAAAQTVRPVPVLTDTEYWRRIQAGEQIDGLRLVKCAQHHLVGPCDCRPLAPQYRAYYVEVDEIAYGGSRGGGKSLLGQIWLMKGNPYEPQDDPVNRSYINHKAYRALVLRRNLNDLQDWVDRGMDMYGKFGAVLSERPILQITFPTGSKFILGHLADDDAYQKYQGHEYQKLLIEEATHIPDPLLFGKLLGSCRSKYICRKKCAKGTCRCGFMKPQVMLNANPGGPGHCVPFGDVLTPDGWRPIQDMREGDPVYTVAKTGDLVATQVDQIHAEKYSGEMVHVNARGLSMVCTPNHRVAKVGGRRGRAKINAKFSLVPFEKLPGQASILRQVGFNSDAVPLQEFSPKKFPTRARRVKQPESIAGADFFELMGWFLSEGHTIDRDKAFGISQIKPHNRAKIADLLDRCQFRAKWDKVGAVIYAPDWWAYFREFGKCRNKFIPRWMLNATTTELWLMFQALMDGDGHWESIDSGTYFTTSVQLADDVSEVAAKLGFAVNINSRQRVDRDGLSYGVNFCRRSSGGSELLTGNHVYDVATQTKRASDITRQQFSGMVYCIGIRGTHSFVIRQNGSVWVSGNSWFKRRFVDPAPPNTPMRDQKSGKTRIYIPARLYDNPYLDKDYERTLLSIPDEPTRKAWINGDWNALGGQYFRDFRSRCLDGEPSNARHVFPRQEKPIAQWAARFAGLDIGYRHYSAFYAFAQDPATRQIITFKEIVEREMGFVEWGIAIAKALTEDLVALQRTGSPAQIIIWTSPDAWEQRDVTRPRVELVADGIRRVLGADSAFVRSTADDAPIDPDAFGIVLRQANRARVAGAQYIRELLRWKPLDLPDIDQFTLDSLRSKDPVAAQRYIDRNREASGEMALPKLVVLDSCVHLIRAIPDLVYDEKGEDVLKTLQVADDVYDAWRYGLHSQNVSTNREPMYSYVQRHITEAQRNGHDTSDINIVAQMERKARYDYQKASPVTHGIRLGRLGDPMSRLRQ